MLDYAMVGVRRWPDSESRKSMVGFLQNEAGSVVVVFRFQQLLTLPSSQSIPTTRDHPSIHTKYFAHSFISQPSPLVSRRALNLR